MPGKLSELSGLNLVHCIIFLQNASPAAQLQAADFT